MKKFFKWFGITVGTLLLLPLLIGLFTRLFMADVPPPGKLYDVGGFNLHMHCEGERNDLPAVIVETGAGTPTPSYFWLQQHLKDRVQVCRYDRAGLGWSDDSVTPRDADTVVSELHALLAAADVQPPYVMAGHSLGGPLIRVFADHYPEEVVGLVFIDASHPHQIERMELPEDMGASSNTVMEVLGDLGLLPYVLDLMGVSEGLAPEQQQAVRWMSRNGRAARESTKEMRDVATVFNRAKQTGPFGDMPIRVFTAGAQPAVMPEDELYKRMYEIWPVLQKELAELSSKGKQVTIADANHGSINTVEAYAKIVAGGVHEILDEIEQAQAEPETQEAFEELPASE